MNTTHKYLFTGGSFLLIIITLFWYINEISVEAKSTNDQRSSIVLSTAPVIDDSVEEVQAKNEVTEELAVYYQTLSKQLQAAISGLKGEIGFTYLDLETGQRIAVNGDKVFHGASTMKVPLVMLISDQVNEGVLSWDDDIKYDKADFEDGTGTIQNNLKDTYKLSELGKLSITVSDNIAKNMLYSTIGGSEAGIKEIYYQYLKKINKSGENQISANDAAKILKLLYQESSTNKDYQQLIQNMTSTAFHERLETSKTVGKVAHKIGSYETNLHDIGIFYNDHPYILTVYTNKVDNAREIISRISDIVWNCQESYPK